MSKIKISYPSGATPIDPDELKDLIPNYVSTMKVTQSFGSITKLSVMGTLEAHTSLEVEGKARSDYVAALMKADNGDFVDLIKFVKS